MAKNVVINGIIYSGIPYVDIPLSGSVGDARFVDTDSGNATASDVRFGKKAWAAGSEITGSLPVMGDTSVVVSGKNITVPAGIYDTQVEKTITDASIGLVASLTGDVVGNDVTDYPVMAVPTATLLQAGYYDTGAKIGTRRTRYIQIEEKTVNPSTSAQDVTPSEGKLLAKVHINAVPIYDGSVS